MNREHKSICYARKIVDGTLKENYVAPRYVIKQCEEFIRIYDGKSKLYMIDELKLKKIESIMKLLVMPRGLKAGTSLCECTTDYQWLLYTAILCTVYRDNTEKRRYQTAILEICRKNFKTYTVAVLFILLFLLEPRFSKFYSVAPDGALSREVKDAIETTLRSSTPIYENKGKKRFKILRDSITCLLTEIKYTPLAYTNSRFDGKLPNVFLADEVGALPNSYAIESMRSGQLNILNKLGCIISTKYPTLHNPFEDEVEYAKKVLDGAINDDSVFSLLYEPDSIKNWETDDLILMQGNPVALEINEIWGDLLKKRDRAVELESARENFLTKHCNIIYQGLGTETYIPIEQVTRCKVPEIDWNGKDVYIGLDLSMTNDNTSVAIVTTDDDNNIIADVIAFVPDGRIDEKNKFEHIDYRKFINAKKCVACGDMTIDYKAVEDFVFSIEELYNCNIVSIGYDRYNALSTAQKLDEKYTTVEVKQHSSVLHPPTKLLSEKIANGEFQYMENKLLEINFENAKCTYDTNMNRYVNKKKSNGKVDMVVSLINAVYLLQQDTIFGDWGVQTF